MTCHDVLSPLTADEFHDQYWSSGFVVIPGPSEKFDPLLDWQTVSSALQRTRFTPERLRLVRDGKTLAPALYLLKPERSDGSLIRTPELTALLADGATLVMDSVHELFGPIGALTEQIEETFHVGAGANLYAGWRPQRGFDLHWDDHDTLILQIAGNKHWQVFEPTVPSPVVAQSVGVVPRPERPPVWDGVLTSGSVLYMPRGWWHVACPADGASLHVTLSIGHQTGADILKWVTSQLLRDVDFRADIPARRSAEQQRAYASRLRSLVCQALTDDVVERHIIARTRDRRRRPRVSLEDVMLSRGVGIGPDTAITLAVGQELPIEVVDGTDSARIALPGGGLTVGMPLVPALRLLRGSRPITVREMGEALNGGNGLAVMSVVTALVGMGVLLAERPAHVRTT